MMIDYVDINNGLMKLFSGDKCIVVGSVGTQTYLAEVALRNGGFSKTVLGSSSFIEAVSGDDEVARECGFENGLEVANLWDDVCNLV